MILVDTNVLVHGVDEYSTFHPACREWIEGRRRSAEPWCTTWPVLYEFLRVTTHCGALRRPWPVRDAMGFVSLLLESPGMQILVATADHARIATAELADLPDASGNIMHDVHTVVLMREHGVRRIATRDTDFRRFRGIEVFDPARS